MFGIVDSRYSDIRSVGILRGKSTTLQNALKKSRTLFKKLKKYEDDIHPVDLHIVKLIGAIKIGNSVEHTQITEFPA